MKERERHMTLHNLKIGDKAPDVVNVVIEIPKGSSNKYEIDEETGAIFLDRPLYGSMHYPADYGFIPETHSEDGDHLDALVLGEAAVFPGCVVRARTLGLLKMIDSGEEDYKIIAVQEDNPRLHWMKSLDDLRSAMPHFEKEVNDFFESYKELQGKKVEILSVEGTEDARKEIERAQKAYTERN